MNDENYRQNPLGFDVLRGRAAERDARHAAERAEREAAKATKAWQVAKLRRERAELWFRADQLRRDLAEVENRAAAIKLPEGEQS